MATSKTLAPTNVTISIPAMTDQPNASVLANCADKEADAINALNSQIAEFIPTKRMRTGTVSSFTINFPTAGQYIVTSTLNGIDYNCILLLNVYGNGTVYVAEIYKGSSVTITSQTNKIVLSTGYSGQYSVNVLALSYGSAASDITIS